MPEEYLSRGFVSPAESGPFWGLPPGHDGNRPWDHVDELPAGGNPNIQSLADQVTSNAEELYANSTGQGGVGSGGFYYEWSKAGWPHSHIGGFPGNVISPTPPFAGCYWDEAWFGLNSDKPIDREYTWPGDGNPFPKRPADEHVPRPTLKAIKAVWAQE